MVGHFAGEIHTKVVVCMAVHGDGNTLESMVVVLMVVQLLGQK